MQRQCRSVPNTKKGAAAEPQPTEKGLKTMDPKDYTGKEWTDLLKEAGFVRLRTS